ncbi:GTP-binding protein [Nitriliruptoraceae bacterium ZYF776]|nr:GTP-binding protein [Profundirhabdus halotolerans]
MTVPGSPERPRSRPSRAPAGKIVVTGPFDAGKTTFVRTITGGTAVATERAVTGHEDGTTTVAMDFGRLALAPDLSLHLFGTPGQDRFEFMWDILAEGMLGSVVVVDVTRPGALEEARHIREAFARLGDVPQVIAVNKVTGSSDAAVATVRRTLEIPVHVPVLVVDARDRASVKRVLVVLLHVVRDRLRAAPPARTGGLTS